MTARELVDALLAVTPAPPVDATVDELLAAFAEVAADRQAILDGALVTGPLSGAVDKAARDELTARQDAWHSALATTREAVGRQRVGTQRMRAYAESARDR